MEFQWGTAVRWLTKVRNSAYGDNLTRVVLLTATGRFPAGYVEPVVMEIYITRLGV